MLAFLKRLFSAAFVIYMSVIAIGLLTIGGLFAWKLVSHDRAEATFKTPSGRWTLRIEESCLLGPCFKYPTVIVPEGWFSSSSLQCDMKDADTSRLLFNRVKAHQWANEETRFSWTAGEPPASGHIDLREDCYRTAVFDDRESLTTLSFKENCLVGSCLRSVSWIESRAGYLYTTPCRVSAHGNEAVFTESNNPAGQIAVTLDSANRRADWMSFGTDQTGQIDFDADCDVSQQTRREKPP